MSCDNAIRLQPLNLLKTTFFCSLFCNYPYIIGETDSTDKPQNTAVKVIILYIVQNQLSSNFFHFATVLFSSNQFTVLDFDAWMDV